MKTRITKNTQSGFSLIELMVVVAIMGILATLAIPSVTGMIGRARQAEAKTGLSQIRTTQEAWKIDPISNGTYNNNVFEAGYSPTGTMRYIVGFSGAGNNSAARCTITTPTVTNGVSCLLHADWIANPAGTVIPATSVVTGGASFIAGAVGKLSRGANDTFVDEWTLNNLGVFTNPQNGL